MGLYQNRILPRLIDLAMRNGRLTPYRQRAISLAGGRVLEIAAGSGLNLPFYPSGVTEILGLDPHPRLLALARRKPYGVRWTAVEGSAEAIPLDDASVDTVVSTWTLCSIPEVAQALREARRVLKPGGKLLFVEHGLAPDASVRGWQQRLTPAWRRMAGGCHLNRPIQELVQQAGFDIVHLETGYMEGPRPMTFTYEGCARAAASPARSIGSAWSSSGRSYLRFPKCDRAFQPLSTLDTVSRRWPGNSPPTASLVRCRERRPKKCSGGHPDSRSVAARTVIFGYHAQRQSSVVLECRATELELTALRTQPIWDCETANTGMR